MVSKVKFGLVSTLLALASATSVQAQNLRHVEREFVGSPSTMLQSPLKAVPVPDVMHDHAWYEARTYTWTDANGITHTASLTDEVTDPYQMYDMLRWVYCNPAIPGMIYTNNTTNKGTVYYGKQTCYITSKNDETGWGITDNDVMTPYENGHTLFLIKVKAEFPDEPATTTSTKQELVTFMGKYIESINLITDGIRAGSSTMFNISGTFNRFFVIGKGKSYYATPKRPDSDGSYAPFAPFYNMFEEYSPTTIDQGSEITDFYESMSNGDTYPVVHDCGSVIGMEHYFSMEGKNAHDERSLSGMIINIPDNRSQSSTSINYNAQQRPTVGMYVIDLHAEADPTDQEHTFDVTLDWTSSLNTIAGSTVPQTYTIYIVTDNGDGTQSTQYLSTTDQTTYTYPVEQEQYSNVISYIIYGNATGNDVIATWSNIATVVIPGYDDFMMLNLDHYESDYVMEEQNNYYRNFLTLSNDYGITLENITAGENIYNLYRCYEDGDTIVKPVATIVFTPGTNGMVHYEIIYNDQDILPGYDLINDLMIATSGWIETNNGVIDMKDIMLVDQFAASTALNEHPAQYGYIVMGTSQKTTNHVLVPVHKTTHELNGFYTQAQVEGDTDHHLTTHVLNADINITLVNNPDIFRYSIIRGDDTMLPNDTISFIQRRTDGSFEEMTSHTFWNAGEFSLLDNDVHTTGNFMAYVPVISAMRSDRVKDGRNTYGAHILRTGAGRVEAGFDGTCISDDWATWRDENGQPCRMYSAAITATGILPQDASIEYEPYMFRVWRLCDDIRGYKIVDGNCVNDPAAPRESDLLTHEMVANATAETTVNMIDGDLTFGALTNADVKFLVRFYYVKKGEKSNDTDPMFYVVETLIDNVEWNDITTGINEVAASIPASKTYVNAQGQTSNMPFDGLNIVITRYSDGTTATYKLVN